MFGNQYHVTVAKPPITRYCSLNYKSRAVNNDYLLTIWVKSPLGYNQINAPLVVPVLDSPYPSYLHIHNSIPLCVAKMVFLITLVPITFMSWCHYPHRRSPLLNITSAYWFVIREWWFSYYGNNVKFHTPTEIFLYTKFRDSHCVPNLIVFGNYPHQKQPTNHGSPGNESMG